MYQVKFYKMGRFIREKTYSTRPEALAAIQAWEEHSLRHSCELIA